MLIAMPERPRSANEIPGVDTLPGHMRRAVRDWIEFGSPAPVDLGPFLCALFQNKLVEAFAHADGRNAAAMKEWATFLYNEMPAAAWKTKANMDTWHGRGGMRGYASGHMAAEPKAEGETHGR